MAAYVINIRNGFFAGERGTTFLAEPGPFLDAAVKSGIITRTDAQTPPVETKDEDKKESGKKKAA